MSYTSKVPNSKVNMILRTADQYELWFSRLAGACWATTKKNLSGITGAECKQATEDARNPENYKKVGFVNRVPIFLILITEASHNDSYLKVAHILKGNIQSLPKNFALRS